MYIPPKLEIFFKMNSRNCFVNWFLVRRFQICILICRYPCIVGFPNWFFSQKNRQIKVKWNFAKKNRPIWWFFFHTEPGEIKRNFLNPSSSRPRREYRFIFFWSHPDDISKFHPATLVSQLKIRGNPNYVYVFLHEVEKLELNI